MAAMKLTRPQQEAWARVRIALDLGDTEAATRYANEASELTQWSRFGPTLQWGAAEIHGTPELPDGWCWLEPGQWRCLVSTGVLDTFGMTNALAEFTEVIQRMDAPGFRSFDPANWTELTDLGY